MSGIQLRFLGTGDAFGSGGRLHTSAHIRAEGGNLLVDCGPSTLAAMRRDALDPNAVDAIVLTHLHGDHFGGVPFLLMEAHYAIGRARPLLIAGPAGVEAAVARAHEALFPGTGALPFRFPLAYLEWQEGQCAVAGPARVTPLPVRHSPVMPCYGLRIEVDGRILAFSGDTEWTETLIALSAGADLFVCECLGFESAPPHHLDYRTLDAHRSLLTCGRLLLTHMGEGMLARAAELGADTASDGLRVSVGDAGETT